MPGKGTLDLFSYTPGELLSFATEPYCRYSPNPTGRYAVIKVLEIKRDQKRAIISVFDFVSTNKPTLDGVRNREIMNGSTLLGQPPHKMIFNLEMPMDDSVPDLLSIGVADLLSEERDAQTTLYVPLDRLSANVEAAWRSVHDRDRFEAELAQLRADAVAHAARFDTRRRERLQGLTIAVLLAETPFFKWEERSEFISPSFLEDIRNQANKMLLEIAALGDRPRRSNVRSKMRSFAEWVNAENRRYADSPPIETLEREELCGFLEEVAWASGQSPLANEVEEWRDW
ncbi:MAG: hypothetical protein AAGB15_00125 [Pseudomonadota bacterium]